MISLTDEIPSSHELVVNRLPLDQRCITHHYDKYHCFLGLKLLVIPWTERIINNYKPGMTVVKR